MHRFLSPFEGKMSRTLSVFKDISPEKADIDLVLFLLPFQSCKQIKLTSNSAQVTHPI